MENSIIQFIDCLFDDNDYIDLRLLPEKVESDYFQTKKRAKRKVLSKNKLKETITSGRFVQYINNTIYYPCIGINPRDAKDWNKLTAIKNIFLDFDNTTPPKDLIDKANIVCQRGNNWHLYFCIQPILPTIENKRRFSHVVNKLIEMSGADVNAKDPTRVARLPYFQHRKNNIYSNGYVVKKLNYNRLSFEDTFAFLGGFKNLCNTQSSNYNDNNNHSRDSNYNNYEDKFIKFLIDFYDKKGKIQQGHGRSLYLYAFGCDCHGWGIDLDKAIELAKDLNARNCLPPEDDIIVEKQIRSAYKYRKAEFGNYRDNFGVLDNIKSNQRAVKDITLLNKIVEKFSNWVYCHEAERFICIDNNLMLTSQNQIENYMLQVIGSKVSFKFVLTYGAVKTVHKLDYRPDKPKFFNENGLDYFNTYIQPKELPRRTKAEETVKIFKEHLEYLTNNERELAWLTAWLAYIVQNKGKKVTWAPVIVSQHTGIGKSALIELLKTIFGDWNVSEVSSFDLIAQHTDYMAEKILVASHEVELAEKEAMHRLKNLITEKKVRIIQKYARTYEATNCANFIFLSNRPDALKIDEEDRRLFVIYNQKEPREQPYYDKLFEAIYDGAGHIYDYLCSISLQSFNPYRRPPITEGKQLMVANSEGELGHYLKHLQAENLSVFGKDYFQTYELYEYVQENAPMSVKRYCSLRMLQLWLSKNKYNSYVLQVKINNKWQKRCYWSNKLSKEDILNQLNLTQNS